MSLLLDARKKSLQAQSAREGGYASQTSELSLEKHPDLTTPEPDTKHPDTKPNAQSVENARSAGQNLFAAKSAAPFAAHHGINRNLLFALAGTVLLLGIGAAYLWYVDFASTSRQLRPINPPSVALPAQPPQPSTAMASTAPQKPLVPGIATTDATAGSEKAQPAPAALPDRSAPAATQKPREASPIRIEQPRTEQLDPLLRDAYLAYRSGKLDDAQRLYQAMFEKDAHNSDALLGLAAIAQQRGESQLAAQHYARVLVLDPRNAAANAGMSALMTDDNSESRLKSLLREQGNSAALHFALGNLYAGQSRWGEAQQAYFNAYTLEPGNAGFAFNLAVSLDHLGQNKLAASHYQRALQLDPLNNAGFDHAQTGQRVQELAH